MIFLYDFIMITNFKYVFSFLILFFVFQVNANQCNEELVKDFPLTLRSSKDLSPDELKKFIQGVDAQLFLQMDENINLYIESINISSKHWNCKSQIFNEDQYNKDYEVFEKQNGLNNISLPCNQKKKILDQVWRDHDNMNTPNYNVFVCSDNQERCGSHYISKRKLKYLNPGYKICEAICECNEDGKSVEYKIKN